MTEEIQKKEIPSFSRGTAERQKEHERNSPELIKSIYADGVVEEKELDILKHNHDEIIRDFLCACDLLKKMEQNPNEYKPETVESTRFVVQRLMLAREKSYAACQKATFYNHIPQEEKERREERQMRQEFLEVSFNLSAIFQKQNRLQDVIEYAHKYEKERLLTPEQEQKINKRLFNLVRQIDERGKQNQFVMQFIKQKEEEELGRVA